MLTSEISLEPIARMSKDMRQAAATMSEQEARYLVDAYYIIQDMRIRSANQVRSMNDEPCSVLHWVFGNMEVVEGQIKGALGRYASGHPVGQRMLEVVGIGPVIAAGLLAHIDITQAPAAGAIWRFAGLDPTMVWEKGKKRPWNATLKTLCWKIGESFVKQSGRDNAYYGHLYISQKEKYLAKNEAGGFKEAALAKASKVGKGTDAYKAYSQGKLPPAHIHAMAKRYAVKMFLSHIFEFWFEWHHGRPAPLPFPIAHHDHVHVVESPIAPAANDTAKQPKAKATPQKKTKKAEAKPKKAAAPRDKSASDWGGMSKHRTSGHAGKSPKARMAMELQIKDDEQYKERKKQQRPKNAMFGSVKDAFSSSTKPKK